MIKDKVMSSLFVGMRAWGIARTRETTQKIKCRAYEVNCDMPSASRVKVMNIGSGELSDGRWE